MAVAVCATTIGVAITSTASFANTNQGQITASALNIRSGPSTSYSVVTKAYRGESVEILESSNGWYKVKLSNGTTGWGSSDYISTSTNSSEGSSDNSTPTPSTGTKATVTASALNIRSGASTSYSIVTKTYSGESVEILESSNGWYKVKLSNGKIGWASASYISTSSNSGGESSDNNTSTGTKATVTASSLNIRSGASTSYSIVTTAYRGESVEILESLNGWHKVKLSNGKIGWASASYISTSSNSGGESSNDSKPTPTPAPTPITGTKATVTASSLNIRSGASTSYSIVTTAYRGEIVEILESLNGWHKVKSSNGKIGWASASYITTSTNSGGESSDNNTQDKAQAIVNLAKAQIGKPYVWGAEGPSSFDCSGLTYYVYGQNGVKLPRVSRDQYNVGTSVSLSNLQPGDLMFSSTDGSGNITHVSVYVGNGEMVHAPKPGDVVKRTSINTSYWQNAYVGAKRVL
jgi:cell wall-associated NlpC family hydrolase